MTLEIRDLTLFKAVVAAGVDQLSKEAWLVDNTAQVKRLENLAENLRHQINRPREYRQGPLRPPVATASS